MYYGVVFGINTFVSALASKPVGMPNGKEQIWLLYGLDMVVYFLIGNSHFVTDVSNINRRG
jgi:hypothetical protein